MIICTPFIIRLLQLSFPGAEGGSNAGASSSWGMWQLPSWAGCTMMSASCPCSNQYTDYRFIFKTWSSNLSMSQDPYISEFTSPSMNLQDSGLYCIPVAYKDCDGICESRDEVFSVKWLAVKQASRGDWTSAWPHLCMLQDPLKEPSHIISMVCFVFFKSRYVTRTDILYLGKVKEQ